MSGYEDKVENGPLGRSNARNEIVRWSKMVERTKAAQISARSLSPSTCCGSQNRGPDRDSASRSKPTEFSLHDNAH
jgi:hypothetical protein